LKLVVQLAPHKINGPHNALIVHFPDLQ